MLDSSKIHEMQGRYFVQGCTNLTRAILLQKLNWPFNVKKKKKEEEANFILAVTPGCSYSCTHNTYKHTVKDRATSSTHNICSDIQSPEWLHQARPALCLVAWLEHVPYKLALHWIYMGSYCAVLLASFMTGCMHSLFHIWISVSSVMSIDPKGHLISEC